MRRTGKPSAWRPRCSTNRKDPDDDQEDARWHPGVGGLHRWSSPRRHHPQRERSRPRGDPGQQGGPQLPHGSRPHPDPRHQHQGRPVHAARHPRVPRLPDRGFARAADDEPAALDPRRRSHADRRQQRRDPPRQAGGLRRGASAAAGPAQPVQERGSRPGGLRLRSGRLPQGRGAPGPRAHRAPGPAARHGHRSPGDLPGGVLPRRRRDRGHRVHGRQHQLRGRRRPGCRRPGRPHLEPLLRAHLRGPGRCQGLP